MDITYILAHVINSNCFNFDRLLKVDVMNLPACLLMISDTDISKKGVFMRWFYCGSNYMDE